MSDQDEDKQYEPTQKKLDDARKKGEVAKSVDLTTAAAYGGFLLVALSIGGTNLQGFGSELSRILARAPELATELFTSPLQSTTTRALSGAALHLVPWFVVPAILAILSVIVQRAFVVAPSKLEPKLSRISLISNAKNKFGRQGLFEFAKSFAKLLIYSAVLGAFLLARTEEIASTIRLAPGQILIVLGGLVIEFVFIVLLITITIGSIDFIWQRAEHIRKNRMSRKELMDEMKQTEGDPYMKQERRQKAQDIALNTMLTDVAKSDVVVVNPTHYAVALKWERGPGTAPVCLAKGVDQIAARIREKATEAGVPIHSDPPTARALYAEVEIGREILPDHYRAVAAAIRFAEAMRAKAGARGWNR